MDLFNKMLLFSQALNEKQREHLLVTALYNDLRLYENRADIRLGHIQRLFAVQKESLTRKFSKVKIDLSINKENWWQQICAANQQLLETPGTKPFERSFALNMWLFRSGLCPMVHYAFDQWYEFGLPSAQNAKTLVENIADLSTTFLYRLIPIQEAFTTPNIIGTGAYSNVYRSDNGQSAYKVPRNLAAREFVSHEEYEASIFALNTRLAPYLPELISYDQTTGVIQRALIRGTTGFKLLGNDEFLRCPYGLNQIKDIYTVACDILKKDGINFDIHPGNIMWNNDRKQWIIADLGPMPTIGSDYFPRGNFDKYFQKIWLDLYRLMVDVPIRSLDIHLDAELPSIRVPKHIKELCL